MDAPAPRVVERLPGWLQAPARLAVRTVASTLADRAPGLAAEMAFFLILSLPPLLVTVFAGIALAGDVANVDLLGLAEERVLLLIGRFVTADTVDALAPTVRGVRDQAQEGIGVLLSFGFLLTLLSASRALRVTATAISIAYDLEETRPGWQQFLYGVGLTLAAMVVGLVILPVFVGGPGLGRTIADTIGLPAEFGTAWRWLYWPAAVVVATLFIATLYHVSAPWWTPWRRDLPGAALAMLIALAGSAGLRLYTDRAIGDLFGTLAAPVVLLLWLYVMSFAVLLGAELNGEIERMWPFRRPDQPQAEERARIARAERAR